MMHKLEASADAYYSGIDGENNIIYAPLFKLSRVHQ